MNAGHRLLLRLKPLLARLGPGRRSERGGVVAIFAAVLGGGAMLSMAAMVVDVGQIYAEREELQSGADSAAVALAKGCIVNPSGCGSQAATARLYADSNAGDGASTVSTVCGRAPLDTLFACPAQPAGLRGCIGSAPSTGNYVEVRTATELPDGTTLLPASFAGSMAGYGTYAGSRIVACARAAYGSPRTVQGLSLTISVCEWMAMTSNGTRFASRTNPSAADEAIIYLHDPQDEDDSPCVNHNGVDAPGGFGWLPQDTARTCNTTATAGAQIGVYPGNGDSSTGCQSLLEQRWEDRNVLLIPIYEEVSCCGMNIKYTVRGFSAFVLTGYYLGNNAAQPSWLSNQHLCGDPSVCLYGYFTNAILPSTGYMGGPDLGAAIITLVG